MKILSTKLIWGAFIALFCYQNSQAQLISRWTSNKYFNVDIYVENTPDSVTKDVKKLANYLTRPFGNEEQKIRAIYYWITHNIAYDTEKLAKMMSDLYRRGLPNSNTTLKIRKGICADYADLFTELCHLSNIVCYTVSGWGGIGENSAPHAGNVIDSTENDIFVGNRILTCI